ncbi:hypothetical protein [Alkalibacillus aidingensis]|uniref:hypothetical protein n=1 Tax=Alkalibacillus aidingensis TaxID=2747607 RepID=UPI001660E019|nr:hypothetical protein [Alkalibacillus aidingensis]
MKKLRWMLVTILFFGSGLTGFFVVTANSNSGEFLSITHTGAKAKIFESYEDVYIGKQLRWTGNEMPIIKDIQIVKENGVSLSSASEMIQVDLFIDPSHQTDLFYQSSPEVHQVIEDYVGVEGFKLTEPQMTLVFKVNLEKPNYQFDLEELKIIYEIDRREFEQRLPLRNFILHH